MSQIVPFGKYKGRQVEDTLHDREYWEWASAQPWFAEKYQPIYNIINNINTQPAETPEHNALQAQFLEADVRRRITKLEGEFEIGKLEFENIWDVSAIIESEEDKYWKLFLVEIKPTVGDDYPAVIRQIRAQGERYAARAGIQWIAPLLYTRAINAKGATEAQIIAMFEASGIRVFVDKESSV